MNRKVYAYEFKPIIVCAVQLLTTCLELINEKLVKLANPIFFLRHRINRVIEMRKKYCLKVKISALLLLYWLLNLYIRSWINRLFPSIIAQRLHASAAGLRIGAFWSQPWPRQLQHVNQLAFKNDLRGKKIRSPIKNDLQDRRWCIIFGLEILTTFVLL